MAQISYGTITITDTTDKNIFIRYSANVDGSDSTSSPVSNTKYIGIYCGTAQTEIEAMASSTGWTWSEYIGTDGVSVTGVTEIYQLRSDSTTPTKRSDGTALPTAVDTVNTWSLKVPPYVNGGTYWTSTAVSMSEAPSPRYTTPVKNEALTDSNYNSAMANSIAQHSNEMANGAMSQSTETQYKTEALDAKLRTFFWPGDTSGTGQYRGAYAVSGRETENPPVTLDETSISTYGFNVAIKPGGISIGYNHIKALELDGGEPSLKLYKPSKVTQGNRTALLNSHGLILEEGGIVAGNYSSTTNKFIYLSTEDHPTDSTNITINGHEPQGSESSPGWRQIIGNSFGVDALGNLYASNVNIKGGIYADTLYLGDVEAEGGQGITWDGTNLFIKNNELTSMSSQLTDLAENQFSMQTIIEQTSSNILLQAIEQGIADNTVITYVLSDDTEVNANTTYYTREIDSQTGEYIYTVVDDPTGNPHTSNYYERDYSKIEENDMVVVARVLTDSFINIDSDSITISADKIKFTSGTGSIPISNYISNQISELNDSINNSLDGKVDSSPNNAASSMTWHGGALAIEAVSGNIKYATIVSGTGIEFVSLYDQLYDELDNPIYGNKVVAGINQDRLVINKTVVLDEMRVGRERDEVTGEDEDKWAWKYDKNDDSIYLKWIGGND